MVLPYADRQMLGKKICPQCRSALIPGPRGGMSQNYFCTNRDTCRAGYNLAFFGRDNTLVFSQQIGEVDNSTYKMYAMERWR